MTGNCGLSAAQYLPRLIHVLQLPLGGRDLQLPHVPPLDKAVLAGGHHLRPGLAGGPHQAVDGLRVGRGERSVAGDERTAGGPEVPAGDLPTVAAPGQQIDLPAVLEARDAALTAQLGKAPCGVPQGEDVAGGGELPGGGGQEVRAAVGYRHLLSLWTEADPTDLQ